MPPVLLSRSLDPILGVFTGAFAFYLNQTNPRTAPPPGQTLMDLVSWKRSKYKSSRSENTQSDGDSEIEETLAGLLKDEGKGQ